MCCKGNSFGGSDLAHWRWFKHSKFGWTTGSQGSKREKFPNRPNSIVRDLRKADGKSWDEQVVRNVCLRCDADDILKIDSSTAGEAPRT